MQNKDDKVGNKTANKQERQRKKDSKRKKIETDFQKKVQILTLAHAWKTKRLLNYVRLVKKNAFLLVKLFETHENQSKEDELVKNPVFSLLDGRHQRVNKVTDLFKLSS